MSSPRFSIIICNYNCEKYIFDRLQSIDKEVRSIDEVIIVDDGSTDGSVEIIESFISDRSNFKMIRHEVNQGVIKSGNRGLSVAMGDYVGWWSADDKILPGIIDHIADVIEQFPQAGLVTTETVFEPVNTTRPARVYRFQMDNEIGFLSPEAFIQENRRQYFWLSSIGMLTRRDLLIEMGGWQEDLSWLSDWFSSYVIAMRYGVAYISVPYSVCREDDGSFGRNAFSDPATRECVIRRFFDILREPSYRDIRRGIYRAPLILTYAFGEWGLKILLMRPADWDLLFVSLLHLLKHRLAAKFGFITMREELLSRNSNVE